MLAAGVIAVTMSFPASAAAQLPKIIIGDSLNKGWKLEKKDSLAQRFLIGAESASPAFGITDTSNNEYLNYWEKLYRITKIRVTIHGDYFGEDNWGACGTIAINSTSQGWIQADWALGRECFAFDEETGEKLGIWYFCIPEYSCNTVYKIDSKTYTIEVGADAFNFWMDPEDEESIIKSDYLWEKEKENEHPEDCFASVAVQNFNEQADKSWTLQGVELLDSSGNTVYSDGKVQISDKIYDPRKESTEINGYLCSAQDDNTLKILGTTLKDEDITIPEKLNNQKVTAIGKEAFSNKDNLKSVTIGANVKTIEDNAFYGCSNLEKVSLSEGIETIGDNAFDCCNKLKNITIPKSVVGIGEDALGYGKYGSISGFKIKCYSGSAGEKYAKDNGFAYEFVNVKKPAAVTGLKTSAISYNTIKLTWNKVTGANGYDIYMNGKKIKTVTSTSYTVAKLKSGTTYKFAVKPYTKNGSSTLYGSTLKTLTTSTNPVTVNFKLTAGSRKATVKWNKVTGASGYKIYYKTLKNGSWKLLKTVNNKTTSYTKTGLTKGKTYYFTVKAYRTVGGKTYNGGYAAKSVKVK